MDAENIRMFLFCVSWIFLTEGSAADTLSADVVYDLLSRRLDNVMLENKMLKLGIEDAASKMENKFDKINGMEKAVREIESRVDKLEEKTLEYEKGLAEMKENVLANEIQDTEKSDLSVNMFKEDITEQSAVVRKMLASEKIFLRRMMKKFDKKLINFKSETQLKMTSVNESLSNLSNLPSDIQTLSHKTDQKLETLQKDTENKSSRILKSTADNSHKIRKLTGKIEKLETKQGKVSAFTAKQPSSGYCRKRKLFFVMDVIDYCDILFNDILLNEGRRYSNGKFVCLYPGLYHFEAYLTAKDNGNNRLDCSVLKNRNNVIDLYQVNPVNARNGTMSTTGSANLHLVKGDEVKMRCDHSSSYLYSSSTFSGFLISSDP